jgi:hypothetical protein
MLVLATETGFLPFKEQVPLKFYKEISAVQCKRKTFRLISLSTPVSFRWTIPLSGKLKYKTWSLQAKKNLARLPQVIPATSGLMCKLVLSLIKATKEISSEKHLGSAYMRKWVYVLLFKVILYIFYIFHIFPYENIRFNAQSITVIHNHLGIDIKYENICIKTISTQQYYCQQGKGKIVTAMQLSHHVNTIEIFCVQVKIEINHAWSTSSSCV